MRPRQGCLATLGGFGNQARWHHCAKPVVPRPTFATTPARRCALPRALKPAPASVLRAQKGRRKIGGVFVAGEDTDGFWTSL